MKLRPNNGFGGNEIKMGTKPNNLSKNQQIEKGDFDCVLALSRSIFFSKLSEGGPVQHSGEDDKER